MTTINWLECLQNASLGVRNVINGEAVECLGKERIKKYAPRDGSLLYELGEGRVEEVDQAVAHARQSFEDGRWSGLPVHQRKSVLYKLSDLLENHKEDLAFYECLDVGKSISQALVDVSIAINFLRQYAEGADKIFAPSITDGTTFTLQIRKPVGVVGAIIGWNFPLVLAVQKMGPALATGNSLVLKPSEFTSLSAGFLALLAIEAGVPPGVFNVVHGAGTTVGSALAQHPDVNLLSFTGSSATGKQMMIAAGQSNMKRLMLECGGKSPYIVFEDCPKDLDKIAASIVANTFDNQGEVCVASSRLLIHESLRDQLLPKVQALTAKLIPQDPLNPESTFGALINEAHLNKVLAYIDCGKQEGAKLIQGGKRVFVDTGDSDSQGYYLEPTIFDHVSPAHKIAQEEIFGPVLSVITFKDEAEAIKIANDTCYGLAAYVATESLSRAQRLSQCLSVGYVVIKGSSTPSGGGVEISLEGHRESGFGHEGGLAGLASYTVSTATYLVG